jgi:hypothetical protein
VLSPENLLDNEKVIRITMVINSRVTKAFAIQHNGFFDI